MPWWKEPTRDQWYAFVAAWLGWTLDAFDFTVFLLIMHPIAQYFHVSMLEVTFVFTITLWMRLIGATASGWIGDRIGRKKPLMVAILGYSLCNLAAGLSPTFSFLFVARAILGLFMGAEWPAGSALAMETWPQRSRGLMGGILQGSWGIGFLMSFAIYGLFYDSIGWRGMLMVGVLPALAVVYVRFFVKEPEVWVECRRLQKAQQREVKVPLFSIFRRGMLRNTLTACWWMASGFVTYYSVTVLFATHLQVDLKMSPGAIGEVGVAANLVTFLASVGWGWVADKYGRRASMIIPALIAIPLAPMYLLSGNFTLIWWGFVLQGAAGSGGMQGQMATYLNERFPTEVRATASGFCYHQGAIWGGLVAPIIAYFATVWGLGYAIPMLIGTMIFASSYVAALLLGPETKGKELVADLVVA
ncbi:MAG TPA: MFS transporter [Rhodopila sp.]|jgi:SHS family lactate transporter-like MFS transporter|nr:MFS transporter [Rhodopila sp.]